MPSKHSIVAVLLISVCLGTLALYVGLGRQKAQPAENAQTENVDLQYLVEHISEFENKKIRVTGMVSYPYPIGVPEFPRFWIDGVMVTVSMGEILPSENSVVTVIGIVVRVGPDSYTISAESWTERTIGNIAIDFLKSTDVPNGGWDNTVEIMENYDHKLGGKILVVSYTTSSGGHPGFFLTAFENHTAIITLNTSGEVVSAFCVQGTFHEQGKIWDLINQRWVQT